MIYTIGHEKSYLEAIANSPNGVLHKMGKRPNGEQFLNVYDRDKQFPNGYPGGYAFRSIADAKRRIEEKYSTSNYAVFGIDANWETDVEPSPRGWWHNLLCDAEIIVLEETIDENQTH